MKQFFILAFLLFNFALMGQTLTIEQEALVKQFKGEKISQEKYTTIAKKWNKTIKKFEQYPDLPLGEDGVVRYTYVSDFANVEKDKLFNRTLEWLSINYGIYPSFIYTNREDGRIIFDSSFDISKNYTGFYTGIISVVDEKVVIELTNISFQAFFTGHYSGETWIPDQTTNLGINEIYPIILKDSEHWDLYLKLFKKANQEAFNVVAGLRNYHNAYEKKYPF